MSNWPILPNGLLVGLRSITGFGTGANNTSPVAMPLQTRATLPLNDRAGSQLFTRVI